MPTMEKKKQEPIDEEKKHPIEIFLEKHSTLGAILFLTMIVLCIAASFINPVALFIFGAIMLIIIIVGGILKLIIFSSRVGSWKEFIFSKKIFGAICAVAIILCTLYLGRTELKDIPYYFTKEFEVYIGSPDEIEIYYSEMSRRIPITYFYLSNGERLHYRGALEGLDPTHEYEFEYMPNSKQIYYFTNLTTGEKWEIRKGLFSYVMPIFLRDIQYI